MADAPNRHKNDRRSLRTRQLLRSALLALLLEERYDNLTVGRILARAEISRAAFYSHYAAKDDLLGDAFATMLATLPISDNTSPLPPIAALAAHIEAQPALRQALARSQSLEILYRTLGAWVGTWVRERCPQITEAALASVVGAVIGGLRWWLDTRLPCPPATLASEISATIDLSSFSR